MADDFILEIKFYAMKTIFNETYLYLPQIVESLASKSNYVITFI